MRFSAVCKLHALPATTVMGVLSWKSQMAFLCVPNSASGLRARLTPVPSMIFCTGQQTSPSEVPMQLARRLCTLLAPFRSLQHARCRTLLSTSTVGCITGDRGSRPARRVLHISVRLMADAPPAYAACRTARERDTSEALSFICGHSKGARHVLDVICSTHADAQTLRRRRRTCFWPWCLRHPLGCSTGVSEHDCGTRARDGCVAALHLGASA